MRKFYHTLQKSWADYWKHHGHSNADMVAQRVAELQARYAPHAVPEHGIREGDFVRNKHSGRVGTVVQVHSSGFITVNHGAAKDHDVEEHHHSDLQKIKTHIAVKGEGMNNWSKWDEAHKGMKAKAKEIFVGFKGRDGMKPEHASAEFDRIHAAGDKDKYISTPRIGATHTQNRQQKLQNVEAFKNAYNHAGFAMEQKQEFSTILKGKGPKGHSWKLVNGKRVYSGGTAAPTVDSLTANAEAIRAKYQPIDNKHYEAAQYHRAQAERGDFTHDEKAPHIAAYQAHRAAGSNAQSAMATANHETHALYANRQEGLSAAAQAATDRSSPVASKLPPPLEGRTQPEGLPENPQPSPLMSRQHPPSAPEAHAPVAAQGVNHPNNHMDVAKTIMQQYGGNRFRAMTGANNFVASAEKGGALTFRVPRTGGATKGIKFVKTVHDPATDTYDVHMLGRNGDTKHSASGIYADQLQSHFKHHTGLDTHL